MARLKASSRIAAAAEKRLSALKSIDPALDLANGLSVAVYQAAIQGVQDKLFTCNTLLSQVDAATNDLRAAEKELRSLSERMLTGVASKYGKDSNEYEMAGGTRKSEIKRSPRKKKAVISG
ncbi:MAG: hypothetical protein WA821_10690 [Anaerolineales bacterium]